MAQSGNNVFPRVPPTADVTTSQVWSARARNVCGWPMGAENMPGVRPIRQAIPLRGGGSRSLIQHIKCLNIFCEDFRGPAATMLLSRIPAQPSPSAQPSPVYPRSALNDVLQAKSITNLRLPPPRLVPLREFRGKIYRELPLAITLCFSASVLARVRTGPRKTKKTLLMNNNSREPPY